jgi:hypothetical protein
MSDWISAVAISVGAVLFDDKHPLSECEDGIEFSGGELIESFELPVERGHRVCCGFHDAVLK